MDEQKSLVQAYIHLSNNLAKPKPDGCKVFAVVSTHGGTGNTTLVYDLIQQFGKHQQLTKPGLVIDPTFAPGGLTNSLLRIPPDKNSGLNALLREILYAKLAGNFSHEEDATKHIKKVNCNIDILPGFCPEDVNGGWLAPEIDELPFIIEELRAHYNFILLDIPRTGALSTFLPVLAVCNYVLMPFNLYHGVSTIDMGWEIDRAIAKLILLGYPIEIGGIVPMFYGPNNDHYEEVSILRKLFGNLVWPVLPDSHYPQELIEQALDRKIAIGSQEILNKFIDLINRKKWPAVRRGWIIDYGSKILDCIEHLDGKLTYKKIAEILLEKYSLELSDNQVREYLRKLTIFGPKSLSYCLDEYRSYYPHRQNPPDDPNDTDLAPAILSILLGKS